MPVCVCARMLRPLTRPLRVDAYIKETLDNIVYTQRSIVRAMSNSHAFTDLLTGFISSMEDCRTSRV
jgi:hypothetical protein